MRLLGVGGLDAPMGAPIGIGMAHPPASFAELKLISGLLNARVIEVATRFDPA
jgi:hypothetical protein